jgi:hypothetical protein
MHIQGLGNDSWSHDIVQKVMQDHKTQYISSVAPDAGSSAPTETIRAPRFDRVEISKPETGASDGQSASASENIPSAGRLAPSVPEIPAAPIESFLRADRIDISAHAAALQDAPSHDLAAIAGSVPLK